MLTALANMYEVEKIEFEIFFNNSVYKESCDDDGEAAALTMSGLINQAS